jgi:antibiotic biosynthesis monooxygenase (ABM) superfamily enzyme
LKNLSGFIFDLEKMNKDPCNSFYRCVLFPQHVEYMERIWLPGIHDEIRNFKGFKHRLVIPPPNIPHRDDDELEYVVILYFSGIENLRKWSTSPERTYWVDQAKLRGIYVGQVEDHGGILSKSVDLPIATTSIKNLKAGLNKHSPAAKQQHHHLPEFLDVHESCSEKGVFHLAKTVPTESAGVVASGGKVQTETLWTPTRIQLQHTMTRAPSAVPPPKYKLFLIVWTSVYISNLTNAFAGDKVKIYSLT